MCAPDSRCGSSLEAAHCARTLCRLLVLAGSLIGTLIFPLLALGATQTIQLTATDPDGKNIGTARLGVPVSLATTNSQPTYPVRSWTLSGAGTLASSGTNNANATYTPPMVMPANPKVVITVTLPGDPPSYPAVSATYTLILINPVPALSLASPTQLLTGGTQALNLYGTGLVAGAVVSLNGTALPTTFDDYWGVTVPVSVAATAAGALNFVVKNPLPGGGQSASFSVPVAVNSVVVAPVGQGATLALGGKVNMAATVSGSSQTAVNWSLTGAGSISTGGTYTAPVATPTGKVTIMAKLVSNPAITGSYQLNIVNPAPVVTKASPTELLTGGTQTVKLAGSGFVPGTTIAFNGASLPITYIDFNDATVQVPVAANATGSLSLQVQNPLPGGGAGSTFVETVEPNSIALTATDADGVNTGTAELGIQVAVSAAVTGSAQTAVLWSLSSTSAGSISTSGIYSAPTVMPVDTRVTIYATLASNPAITANYVLHIINPIPEIARASPTTVSPGATTAVTLTGTGFVPITVIQVNSADVPTTYISSASLVAQVAAAASATGSISFRAYTGLPGGGHGNYFSEAIAAPIGATEAARLLDQTTFGPTTSLIQHVEQEGVTAWLTEQLNTAPTALPIIPTVFPSYCGDAEMCLESEWWKTVLTGNDQLRQRVAFALSEIFVVSSDTVTGQGINAYANMLANDAFTNWYTIMNDVTLSPAMSIYLNMENSYKPNATQIANENFARENMQLFNLGLDLLNGDATLQINANGNPTPAYTEAQVQAFARAFTGWTFANLDGSTPSEFIGTPNYYHPMVAVEQWHDENPKTLLNGTVLPAGQTAEEDLAGALTNIFQHPNTPPFVSKQLIQHLVKSDPSPAYVARVATVFANNANNVRGDMPSVLTAIFTDPEARAGDTAPQASDGHLREPILWLTSAMRGLGYVNIDPNSYYQYLSDYSGALSEVVYQSPSVFNFYPPGYVVPGTALNAPEFGLENTASVTDRLTLADQLVNNQINGFNVDMSATSPLGKIETSSGPTGLVNALSSLFLYGEMDPATAAAIASEVSNVTDPAQRLRLAAYLVLTFSEYKILH